MAFHVILQFHVCQKYINNSLVIHLTFAYYVVRDSKTYYELDRVFHELSLSLYIFVTYISPSVRSKNISKEIKYTKYS